jgi:hypothetical protein
MAMKIQNAAGVLLALLAFAVCPLSNAGPGALRYSVLAPVSQGNLTVFPVIASTSFDTGKLMTLDEGIRSGQVIVTEETGATGLVRPRSTEGVWQERPYPMPPHAARVNELALVNNSDQPLLLLGGEIVTGGKQDRVVGKDRIIPAHSEPVALSVFCVEPHRWTGPSIVFGTLGFSIAQPSVRSKAMADQNQQEVWNQVAKSRSAFVASAPPSEMSAMAGTSSYAAAMQNGAVQQKIDSLALPLGRSYQKLLDGIRSQHAVGVVVAVNQEIIWADVFANSSLLERYWPKLVRSYAADAIMPGIAPSFSYAPPTREAAQEFLDHLSAKHESVETEPGVYRSTEIVGDDFEAFLLTALLPGTGFDVHLAKMRR